MLPKSESTCECGATVCDGWMVIHRNSSYHRQHLLIRQMLEECTISFSVIANRVDLTRERIRQIARDLGFPSGKERHTLAAQDILEYNFDERETVQELISLGLDVAPFYYEKGKLKVPHRRILIINERVCTVGIITSRSEGRHATIHTPKNKSEFFIGKCQEDWFVIPWGELPEKSTMFTLTLKSPQMGAKSHRHNWLDYENAWHLLEKKGE